MDSTGTVAPSGRVDAQQHALVEGLDLHVGLVGLDLEERVAPDDLVALLLEPLQDGALLGHLAGHGHADRDGHQMSPRTAAAMSAALGRKASSSASACGEMPLAAPMRATGASRSSKASFTTRATISLT